MKLTVLLLVVSLVINVTWVGLHFARPVLAPPAFRNYFTAEADPAAAAAETLRVQRTRAAARVQAEAGRAAAERARLWSRLDSSDLPTLIARLRAAGFPPAVIRGIVAARVEALFRPRIAEITGDALVAPFWKPDPMGFSALGRLLDASAQISRERTLLLRQLLNDPFFTQDPTATSEAQRVRYGELPAAKIELVERINRDYADMDQQIRAATNGILLAEDREKLAYLQLERRKDLATVLSPAELEEHLLRSSPFTSRLREALTVMDATEAEFRALCAIHAPHVDVLFPGFGGSGGTTLEMLLKRRELEATLSQQVRAALGEERTADFNRARSFEFQQLVRITQQENLPREAAVRAFELRNNAARESRRIDQDRALALEQKREALRALAQTTSNQLLATLGNNAGQLYFKTATWLPVIAGGGVVTFQTEGGWGWHSVTPSPNPAPAGRP